jgi:hypothetical protein
MCKELDPNEILSREFEYAAQTAFQAHEDRVRVFNYYLATAGTLVATVVVVDLTNSTNLLAVFSLLFAGLALLGFGSFLQLIKLRLAWTDSVRAMCQIKEYYIRMCDELELTGAFRWKMETIPSVGKKWTVAFLMGLTTALLSSACACGAVLLWGLAATGSPWSIQGALAGLSSLAAQLAVWLRLCRD